MSGVYEDNMRRWYR